MINNLIAQPARKSVEPLIVRVAADTARWCSNPLRWLVGGGSTFSTGAMKRFDTALSTGIRVEITRQNGRDYD